jgi:TolB-like protein
MTDAVRGKLTSLPNLDVIARVSSESYRNAHKTPAQIAKELGVRYLLTGTVRWAKGQDGTSRVQVSPELVEVDPGDASARSRWQQPFDAPLTDVFKVQSDIAGKVASALNVALGTSDRQKMDTRPTTNLVAYDAYLQAQATSQSDPASQTRAAELYRQAATLDSTFGIAWAGLALKLEQLYLSSLTIRPRAPIDSALAKAREFAPDAAETYRARIGYALAVLGDLPGARKLTDEAVARYPADAALVRQEANADIIAGDTARSIAKVQKLILMDPRNAHNFRFLGSVFQVQARWKESQDMYSRALIVSPGDFGSVQGVIIAELAQGDLTAARNTLNSAQGVDRKQILAMNAMYQDLYWLLDRAQQDTVLALPRRYFDNDRGSQAFAFAEIYHQRGDIARTKLWADSARIAFKAYSAAQGTPQGAAQAAGLLGVSLQYLGRHAEAVKAAERSVTIATAAAPTTGDLTLADYGRLLLARIYILDGNQNNAIDILEHFPDTKSFVTPAWMAIDPTFAPLKGNPRFEKLIHGS